ncbi:MAG: glycosyltransferase family A protein [Anaerolineales bacterium]
MTNNMPLLTIGVLSWNRLHYLRATLESAHRCIKYPNIQWIVVDNCSTEVGLTDYLKSLSWVDDLVFMESDHITAMNEIIRRARGEVVLIWPDDMQFIVEGDWMVDCVEILMKNPSLGSMSISGLRRLTLRDIWGKKLPTLKDIRIILNEIKRFGPNFRFQKRIESSRGFPVLTYGWKEDGIVGSGIPTLSRIDVWKTLGPWKAKPDSNINDSSQGGETEMLERWLHSRIPWQRSLTVLPLSADILTDSTGTKAKVRGKKRYGAYMPPMQDYYYQIYRQDEKEEVLKRPLPASFEDFVKPVGFKLPLDENGDLLKTGINLTVSNSVD